VPEAEGHARTAEIADGIFALGNLVDLRRPLSWIPGGVTGFDPSSCYLVLGDGWPLLVDTGFRTHQAELLDQVRRLVHPGERLDVALTRVEPDCLGNLKAICDEVGVARISSQSNVIPLDYLGPYSQDYPDVVINNGLLPGDEIRLADDRCLEVVQPPVRTLPTLWLFDKRTGVMFTSDFFGDVQVLNGNWMPQHEGEMEHARNHMLAKFDWLGIADVSEPLARLRAIFDERDVQAIAPGHGLWTVGAGAVRERVALTTLALESIGNDRR
jgi:flavorubredoxin